MTVSYSQGDTLPPQIVVLKEPIPSCPTMSQPIDLTELEVRGRFFSAFIRHIDSCGNVQNCTCGITTDAAIFYRVLTKLETTLLDESVAVGPTLFSLDVQPAGEQRFSIEITGFAGAGTIELTGTDVDGEEVTETVNVTAGGSLFTTESFAAINEDGVEMTGTFDARIYVHDGRVQVDWEDGDFENIGLHLLEFELLDTTGARRTLREKLEVLVEAKRIAPLPIVEDFSPVSLSPTDTLTVEGKHFLDTSKIEIVADLDGTVVELENLVLVDGTEAAGDIPAATALGTYGVRITTPGGTSELVSGLTIA